MSLVPARENLTIYQGATFYQSIIFKIDGVLQDVSGYKAELPIKDEIRGTTLLTLDSFSNGGITLGSNGTINLLITSDVTKDILWPNAIYELLLTDLTPRTDIVLYGGVKVIPF